jgi:hypothetical protein
MAVFWLLFGSGLCDKTNISTSGLKCYAVVLPNIFCFWSFHSTQPPFFSCDAVARFWVMVSPYGASRSHSLDTSYSVRLLWTSDQPDAGTSTWQHTTLTRDRHPCARRDLFRISVWLSKFPCLRNCCVLTLRLWYRITELIKLNEYFSPSE